MKTVAYTTMMAMVLFGDVASAQAGRDKRRTGLP